MLCVIILFYWVTLYYSQRACAWRRPPGKKGRPSLFRGNNYTPDLAKMKVRWKMPLKVHWNHSSEHPLDKWQSCRTYHRQVKFPWKMPLKIHLKMPLKIHLKMPLKIHDDFWGVDFWRAIFCPYSRCLSRGRCGSPRVTAARSPIHWSPASFHRAHWCIPFGDHPLNL